MGKLKIPEHVLNALLTVASDYMTEDEFHRLLDTDWESMADAGPAWKSINHCLEGIALSSYPGPKETMISVDVVLARYQLKFDGKKIKRINHRGSKPEPSRH